MPKGFSAWSQRAGKTTAERLAFYSRPSASGCRLWVGARMPKGYGKLVVDGKPMLAHRAAWIEKHGPISAGLCVCHRCDTPACIEVDHLFLGTRRDNTQDMIAKGRQANVVGSTSPCAKLTDNEVLAIRADDRRHDLIGAQYDIHPATVSRIKSRERWGHIP